MYVYIYIYIYISISIYIYVQYTHHGGKGRQSVVCMPRYEETEETCSIVRFLCTIWLWLTNDQLSGSTLTKRTEIVLMPSGVPSNGI